MGFNVLSGLDKAQTQLYHFQAILIVGMGFSRTHTTYFAFLRMGRKKVFRITLTLMVASSILSGFSLGRSRKSVLTCLCFFRFWLGFGIGGDYPLSATIMAEYSNTKTRGSFIASVYAMQGFGILAASAVAISVSASFRSEFPDTTREQQDMVWRIILMFGGVPAGITYYWRMRMPETARYTALVTRNSKQATSDMSRVLVLDIEEDDGDIFEIREQPFGLFSMAFLRLHGLHLLGTAFTLFVVDIAFYSLNLFQKNIYNLVGWLNEYINYDSPVDEVYDIARARAMIVLFSMIPGYFFAILLVDRIGRFKIQLVGFFFMSVFLFALGIPFNAELFPARLRSTCHGISAAAGKAGALIGVFGFIYASQSTRNDAPPSSDGYPTGIGISRALILLGVAACLGFLFTFLIPETKDRSLEKNEVELALPLSERGFNNTEQNISHNV
ncbi:hypothetical protein SUGI_0868750 [Cryptomeria japonica]|nr:hypothetical protein SUGI_0868750 [Cryptomeria japonica]